MKMKLKEALDELELEEGANEEEIKKAYKKKALVW
jgi:curved DNA-binding protein CbpA